MSLIQKGKRLEQIDRNKNKITHDVGSKRNKSKLNLFDMHINVIDIKGNKTKHKEKATSTEENETTSVTTKCIVKQ